MQQIRNLTGLRAFAALSVMLMHVRYEELADRYGPFAFLFKNQSLGVYVFFILSGFILAYVHHRDFADGISGADARSFLWARFARIYPVHLFMLVVVALLLPWFGIYLWRAGDAWLLSETWYALTANLLLIHAWGFPGNVSFNEVSWSISAEWFAYLCFPLIAFVTRNWRTWMFVGIAAALVWIEPPTMMLDFTFGKNAVICLMLFVIGFCTYRFGGDLPSSWLWRAGGILIGPLLVYLFWRQVPYFQHLFVTLTTLLILCLFKAGPIFFYANPVSVYLGKISYSLYMSHVISFLTLRLIAGEVLQLRYEIPAMIAVAAAIYHFVEEPARNLMRSQWWVPNFNRAG